MSETPCGAYGKRCVKIVFSMHMDLKNPSCFISDLKDCDAMMIALRHLLPGVVIMALFMAGCSGQGSSPEQIADELIRVGDQRVSVAEYLHALEVEKTAYPHNLIQNRSVLQRVRRQVLNQMIQELILCNRAVDLGIAVSEAELDAAVDSIREGFPDDTFEQTLLENAIPYPYWRKRLKIRLLMGKVLATELKSGETTEQAYGEWILGLEQTYPVRINMERWQEIAGSCGLSDNDFSRAAGKSRIHPYIDDR